MLPKIAIRRNYFFPLQTANVAYFQKKSNYADFLHIRMARLPHPEKN
jgi:hypothetical protein